MPMTAKDVQLIMGEVASVVKRYVSTSVDPVVTKITAIEDRINNFPVPQNGRDATPDETARIVFLTLTPEIEKIKAELADVKAIAPKFDELTETIAFQIPEQVSKAFAAMPIPQDGKSVSIDDLLPVIDEHVSKAIEPKVDEISLKVQAELPVQIEQAIAALPKPQDGKSISVDDVAPLVSETVSRAISELPVPQDGKDGLGLANALIDRDGNLVLTLTDGTAKELGRIVGKDGETPLLPEIPELPEFPEYVPEDLAENVAKAVRLMAETPIHVSREPNSNGSQSNAPVTIKMPDVIVPPIEFPDFPAFPEIKAPAVNVTIQQPKKRAMRKTIEAYDKNGRIKKVLEEELD